MTEFISFITCEACERCKLEQRKTIIGDDILYALEIFGLSEYVSILKLYLAKYREMEMEELEQEKKMASQMEEEKEFEVEKSESEISEIKGDLSMIKSNVTL